MNQLSGESAPSSLTKAFTFDAFNVQQNAPMPKATLTNLLPAAHPDSTVNLCVRWHKPVSAGVFTHSSDRDHQLLNTLESPFMLFHALKHKHTTHYLLH